MARRQADLVLLTPISYSQLRDLVSRLLLVKSDAVVCWCLGFNFLEA